MTVFTQEGVSFIHQIWSTNLTELHQTRGHNSFGYDSKIHPQALASFLNEVKLGTLTWNFMGTDLLLESASLAQQELQFLTHCSALGGAWSYTADSL